MYIKKPHKYEKNFQNLIKNHVISGKNIFYLSQNDYIHI